MATFYGTVQGGRTAASRLGHDNTGLKVTAQSYDGSIIVHLFKANHKTYATIAIHSGSAGSGGTTLFSGPIEELFDDTLINFK